MSRHKVDKEKEYVALLERVWPVIRTVCHFQLGIYGIETEDYLQEVRIRLWKAYNNIGWDTRQLLCTETTFVYTIAYNAAKKYRKERIKRGKATEGLPVLIENSLSYSTLEADNKRESREYLYQLMGELNKNDKELLMMDIQGYSDEEIAGVWYRLFCHKQWGMLPSVR